MLKCLCNSECDIIMNGKELSDLYRSPTIVGILKWRNLLWTELGKQVCIQKFGGEGSWGTSTWKTEKEMEG